MIMSKHMSVMLLVLLSLQLAFVQAAGTDDGGSGHTDSGLPIVFLMVALTIGAAVKHLVSVFKLPVPYTVLLLICGIILGSIQLPAGSNNLGSFGESMLEYSHVDPHLLLVLFLPPLIFESAFTANFHIIWREIGQALLLAGPGVLVATGLTALVVKYWFDYGFSWAACLMTGAMLSATDPVAVVALLREIGASKRLATLIEAESLLNDGTAFVLFLIFKDFEIGLDRNAGEIVFYMLRLSLGGVALGLAMAIPAVWWLGRVFNDARIETTITIVVAYLTFWLAESPELDLKCSGVLAVVTLGLYLAKNRTCISPHIEHHLHHVWEMVSYIANTLIFIISGVIVAEKMFAGSVFSVTDIGYLLLLYFILHVIRAFAIICLSPLLSKIGYGLTWQSGTILVYGGLRGAIGLALALLVELEDDIDETVRDRVLFHMSGIVLLTLVVNGSTTKYVLEKVGLARMSKASSNVYHKALDHLSHETEILLSSLRHNKHFSGANWQLIRRMLPKYEKNIEDQIIESADDYKDGAIRLGFGEDQTQASLGKEHNHHHNYDKEGKLLVTDNQKLKLEVSHRFISAMKASYWHQFEEGLTSRAAVMVLIEAAEKALDIDNLEDLSVQWQEIQHHFIVPAWLTRLQNCFPALGDHLLYNKLAFSVELATAYLSASEGTEEIEHHFPEFSEIEAYTELKAECHRYRVEALQQWLSIQKSFPEIYRSVQTKHAAHFILTKEKHTIQELYELGVLEEKEYQNMSELVDKSIYSLERDPPKTDTADKNAILQDLDFYQFLSSAEREELRHAKLHLFNTDEIVYQKGDVLTGVHIIIRGIVEQERLQKGMDGASESDRLGVGSLVGVWSLLTGLPAQGDTHAKTYLECVFLPASLVDSYMKNSPEICAYLWKLAGACLIKDQFLNEFGYSSLLVDRLCLASDYFETQDEEKVLRTKCPILMLEGSCLVDQEVRRKGKRHRRRKSVDGGSDKKSGQRNKLRRKTGKKSRRKGGPHRLNETSDQSESEWVSTDDIHLGPLDPATSFNLTTSSYPNNRVELAKAESLLLDDSSSRSPSPVPSPSPTPDSLISRSRASSLLQSPEARSGVSSSPNPPERSSALTVVTVNDDEQSSIAALRLALEAERKALYENESKSDNEPIDDNHQEEKKVMNDENHEGQDKKEEEPTAYPEMSLVAKRDSASFVADRLELATRIAAEKSGMKLSEGFNCERDEIKIKIGTIVPDLALSSPTGAPDDQSCTETGTETYHRKKRRLRRGSSMTLPSRMVTEPALLPPGRTYHFLPNSRILVFGSILKKQNRISKARSFHRKHDQGKRHYRRHRAESKRINGMVNEVKLGLNQPESTVGDSSDMLGEAGGALEMKTIASNDQGVNKNQTEKSNNSNDDSNNTKKNTDNNDNDENGIEIKVVSGPGRKAANNYTNDNSKNHDSSNSLHMDGDGTNDIGTDIDPSEMKAMHRRQRSISSAGGRRHRRSSTEAGNFRHSLMPPLSLDEIGTMHVRTGGTDDIRSQGVAAFHGDPLMRASTGPPTLSSHRRRSQSVPDIDPNLLASISAKYRNDKKADNKKTGDQRDHEKNMFKELRRAANRDLQPKKHQRKHLHLRRRQINRNLKGHCRVVALCNKWKRKTEQPLAMIDTVESENDEDSKNAE